MGEGSGVSSGAGVASGVGEGEGAGTSSPAGETTAAVKAALSQLTWAPSCSDTKRRGTMVLSFPSQDTTPAGTPSGRVTLWPLTRAWAEPRVRTIVSDPFWRITCRVSGTQVTDAPRFSAMRRTGTRVRPFCPSGYCTRAGTSRG